MEWITERSMRAFVLKGTDVEAFRDAIARDVVAGPKKKGRVKKRAKTAVGAPEPTFASDTAVELRERLDEVFAQLFLRAFECKNCGRLFIHEGRGSKHFARFEPEYTTKRPVLE
jgi:hypothetical protein